MPKANHFVPPLLVLFLGCTALTGGAQAGWFDFGSEKPQPAAPQPEAKEKAPPAAAANLDDSIRQAQMLRLAGSYAEAVKHLSQLMMVAADDPRVISEYGKTLAQMGRASDAVNFLNRATQLSPTDWTVYSAMGVAYDQIGNQKLAQVAYEHALALHPGEASILNNYALSRMLAKDTAMAQSLAAKAEMANAASKDDKIARNVTMIRGMTPETAPVKAEANIAANKPPTFMPAPQQPVAQQASGQVDGHVAQTPAKVTQAPLPAPTPDNRVVMQRVPTDPLAGPVASHAPQSLTSKTAQVSPASDNRVVMQHVPVDPLAGPVASHAPHTAAKTELAAKPETKTTVTKPVVKPDALAAKAEPVHPAPKPDVKDAPKPAIKAAEVKAAPAKPDAKIAEAKPAETKAVKLDIAPPKPEAKPEVKPEVKAASAKPMPLKPDAKAEVRPADSKTSIPGLRLSANAF